MSTKLEADLAITSISKHPKNPRHTAVADDDMVASVRENGLIQPVVVAPATPGKYVLIAGHRRVDAAKKAKRKTVPAIIREDLATEGQQIEAMIIENGHRLDLTPIEEAEGYAQLELLGYKAAGIAAAVGRDVKTVRSRLKLLKLSPTTKKKVHAGQVTIDDAIAIGEFSDDPDATKKLEAAATSGNLRYEITSQKQRRDQLQKNATLVAQLVDAGAKLLEVPDGKARWQFVDEQNLVYVSTSDTEAWAQHTDCLGYIEETGSWPAVHVYCTNHVSHLAAGDDEPAGVAATRESRMEQERQEREARKAAEAAAIAARVTLLTELLGTTTKLPATLADLIRVLLPQALIRVDDTKVDEGYAIALGLEEADRWDRVTGWDDAARAKRTTLLNQHISDLTDGTHGFLARAIVAFLLGWAEANVDQVTFGGDPDPQDATQVRSYYALLEAAGHTLTDHDRTVHETLAAADAEAEAEAS